MEKLPAGIARSLAGGILVVLLALLIFAVLFIQPVSPLPHIVPDASLAASPPVMVTHSFPYGNATITITVPVNSSVLAGAKRVERKAVNIHNASEIEGDMYRAMINDPAQEPLFGDLLSRFRSIRAVRNLSDDEYLDLMTRYVQSLNYTQSDAPALYPVETVMGNGGDCDDKSLLLAGLLAREGYPVALLLFRPEQHMAVGVGSDTPPYRSTGYAYIEVTGYAPVGVPPAVLRGNITLKSNPVVIPVSNGMKRYHGSG
jgi:hypothetical protein